MENNDGNMKSPQTGGLKLMTVFIAVLALHVVVIGGFTVYHLMTGSTDTDMAIDKTLKKTDVAASTDGTTPDASKPASADGTAPVSTSATTATTDTTTPTPIPSTVPKPAPTTTVTTIAPTKPTTPAPVVTLAPNASSPGVASLAPPPEPTLSLAAPAPLTPLTTTPIGSMPLTPGPVHMPPAASTHDVAVTHSTEALSKKETYTVKITDSYKKIAKAHHVSVAQLKEANNIKGDTLHAGQKLVIPSAKTSLARNDGSSTASLAAAPSGTSSHHHTYVVKEGDTLSYIARKFNTTKTAILAANDISNPTKLTPGRKLKIPAAKETRSASNSAPAYAPVKPIAPVAPVEAPVAQPAPTTQPVASQPYSPQPTVTPELANMTF